MAGRLREIRVTEGPAIPWDGLIFGWVPMLPFPAAVLGVWLGGEALAALALRLAVLWGAALLLFLAGVRRGLSFRTPGGPRLSQLGMMLGLFLAGLLALLLPLAWALLLLWAGFLALLVLDPVAARREEAPLYFARLRPPQMAVPVVCLLILWGLAVLGFV